METPSGAVIDHRDVYFEESGLVRCPVYDRSKFGRCPRVDGPCIVEQMDSTTVIPPNTWFEVDIHGNLIVNAFGDGKGGDEA
jgi:N-methylhydantoinase A